MSQPDFRVARPEALRRACRICKDSTPFEASGRATHQKNKCDRLLSFPAEVDPVRFPIQRTGVGVWNVRVRRSGQVHVRRGAGARRMAESQLAVRGNRTVIVVHRMVPSGWPEMKADGILAASREPRSRFGLVWRKEIIAFARRTRASGRAGSAASARRPRSTMGRGR